MATADDFSRNPLYQELLIMAKAYRRIESKLIHAGEPEPRIEGAVAMPIFQTAMFEYAGETSYDDLKYIRLNNTPNHQALHAKLAALENAEAALVTGSGMAAIATTLLTLLPAGSHLLIQDCLYGGTYDFVTRDFASFGLEYTLIDANQASTWEPHLRPNTKAIFVESMTNPLLQVGDLAAIPRFAKAHGLYAIIDNTFASPINFRPLERGYDLSLHSGTKYLNGHNDIVCGVVLGARQLVGTITHRLNHLGGCLDPHAAFLLHRGLKTLALRVAFQNQSALQVARMLEGHSAVARVNYAGLESHPSHARARDLFQGFGGVLSFEPKGGVEAAERFLKTVKLPAIAPSLGGIETLATRPAITSHAGLLPEDRRKIGISDSLIRLSIGIEATEDILDDFTQALH
ncbi:MAG: aminotransferase class I/II-fold pyridoxal phosphate-dependent enzyme [Terriglobia bacterium]